jgi:hypothetical protein
MSVFVSFVITLCCRWFIKNYHYHVSVTIHTYFAGTGTDVFYATY